MLVVMFYQKFVCLFFLKKDALFMISEIVTRNIFLQIFLKPHKHFATWTQDTQIWLREQQDSDLENELF